MVHLHTKNSVKHLSFFKFLITYVAYLIFLIIIMFVINKHNLSYWENNELSHYEIELNKKVDDFKHQLVVMTTLVDKLKNDARYTSLCSPNSFSQYDDYINAEQVQKDFSATLLSLTLVNDSGMYFSNHTLLTRYRIFPNTSFFHNNLNSFFSIKGYNQEELFPKLLNVNNNCLFPARNITSKDFGTYEALIWAVPFKYSITNYGTFYATISKDTLANFFIANDLLADSYLYITDYTGSPFLNYKYEPDLNFNSFYEITQEDSFTGLIFKLGIPKTYVTMLIKPFLSSIALYMFFLFLGGAILAIIFSYSNSKPVHKLVVAASSLDENSSTNIKNKSEYEYVSNIMNNIHDSLNITRKQLVIQKDEAQCLLLDKAIRGDLSTSSAFTKFSELFPDFPEKYCLVILSIQNDQVCSIDEELSKQLTIQHALYTYFNNYITVVSSFTDIIEFVVSAERTDLATLSEDLKQLILNQYHMNVQVLASSPQTDLIEMPSVFADLLYQMQLLQGHQPINCLSNLPLDFISLQQFYEALNDGGQEITLAILTKIHSSLVSFNKAVTNTHEFTYSSINNQVLSNLCTIMLHVKLNYFELLSGIHIPSNNSFRDIDSLFSEIKSCCLEICKGINSNKSILKQNLQAKKILSFLEKNMTDSNLSVSYVADYFHISENTLQKIIRSVSGKTFYEYVESHRLDMAYELLKASNSSVSEIALSCGFSSYNSMYKTFKRKLNISPGSIALNKEGAEH